MAASIAGNRGMSMHRGNVAACTADIARGRGFAQGHGRRSVVLLTHDDMSIIRNAFQNADIDGSGALGEMEMQNMWRMVFPHMSIESLRTMTDAMHQDLDPNDDGYVSWPEFEKFFNRLYDRSSWTAVEVLVNGTLIERAPTWKECMWAVMDYDTTEYMFMPKWLQFVQKVVLVFSNLTLVISIAAFIIEAEPQYIRAATMEKGAFYVVEAVCIAVFSLELLLRIVSTPSHSKFWRDLFTYVDMAAIVPFYVSIFDQRGADVAEETNPSNTVLLLRMLRMLRLLRVLRLLRLGGRLETVQVLAIAVWRTAQPLMVSMICVNAVALIFFSSLISIAERDQASFDVGQQLWVRWNNSRYVDAGSEIQFQSVTVSMWWAWVTLTTVGYGDMSPVTAGGKIVAGATMLVGVVLMAFPLTLLSNAFANVVRELREAQSRFERSAVFSRQMRAAKQLNLIRIGTPMSPIAAAMEHSTETTPNAGQIDHNDPVRIDELISPQVCDHDTNQRSPVPTVRDSPTSHPKLGVTQATPDAEQSAAAREFPRQNMTGSEMFPMGEGASQSLSPRPNTSRQASLASLSGYISAYSRPAGVLRRHNTLRKNPLTRDVSIHIPPGARSPKIPLMTLRRTQSARALSPRAKPDTGPSPAAGRSQQHLPSSHGPLQTGTRSCWDPCVAVSPKSQPQQLHGAPDAAQGLHLNTAQADRLCAQVSEIAHRVERIEQHLAAGTAGRGYARVHVPPPPHQPGKGRSPAAVPAPTPPMSPPPFPVPSPPTPAVPLAAGGRVSPSPPRHAAPPDTPPAPASWPPATGCARRVSGTGSSNLPNEENASGLPSTSALRVTSPQRGSERRSTEDRPLLNSDPGDDHSPHSAQSMSEIRVPLSFFASPTASPGRSRDPNALERLTYVSLQRNGLSGREAEAIATFAQVRNQELGVTGFLVHAAPHFFQTIEGPPDSISQLWASIANDSRHTDLSIVERLQVPRRFHPRWAMETVQVSGVASDPRLLSRDWLIAEMMRHVDTDHAAPDRASLADSITPPPTYTVQPL